MIALLSSEQAKEQDVAEPHSAAFTPLLATAPTIGLLVQQVEERRQAQERQTRQEAEPERQKQAKTAQIAEWLRQRARRPYGAD